MEIANHVLSVNLFNNLALLVDEYDFGTIKERAGYRNQQIQGFIDQIEIGLNFIRKVTEEHNLDKLHTGDGHLCEDVLRNYLKVAEAINYYFGQDKINTQAIKDLDDKIAMPLMNIVMGSYKSASEEVKAIEAKKLSSDEPQKKTRFDS